MTNSGKDANLAERLLRTRWLVRAPIWLFRARLGWVFGTRLLLLEHLGRKSRQPRSAVLEVVDRTDSGYVVASGFGEQAQWLRNLDAHPEAFVSTGARTRIPVTARRLPPAEATATLRRYAARNPRAWAKLRPVLERTLGARIDESGTTLPLVALEERCPRG
ncbi:nitroreductase family deazaflavin-dependent oxidoreductase [Saccharopolyspora rhizosphaerae]|uniref:Nitroreductase family deazaflavin-dependent oxidoreductase n=1 Tax=Saccharopolyspora rhizosphaerae TaxID=2492662 RepID=A0A426JKD4_9PSEU|nr:nitroreductase family deazaflavin-dependent oxidoreductase [Saccharopolyspora rhizosphaerae]RRO13646.1 nitroreductase family deazaflavin-dependent oxidoreductase [Saccharopolyspora rhizosphaerae]